MANWKINKKGWFISWYNIKNEPMDEYPQCYNEVYQNNPKEYFKKIFKFKYKGIGIEYVNEWNGTRLLFVGSRNIYWFYLRQSSHYTDKAKWKIEFKVSSNDGVDCG